MIGLFRTLAGVRVDEDRALRYVAVWSCVQVISESIAALPWHVFERQPDDSRKQIESAVDRLLSKVPNPEMTPFTFIELMLGWLLTWGNAYAEIARDRAGRPIALWPVPPNRVGPKRDTDGALVYRVTQNLGPPVFIPARDMLHFKGMGFDGLVGYSPIQYAANAIGLGLATETYGSAFFGNGAQPGGILEYPAELDDKDYANFKASWEQEHRGPHKANAVTILENGMTWKSVGFPNDAAQFLQTRKLQLEELARFYRVPAHKVGIMDRATFSNIEQQSIEFVTDTLVPWMVRMEQEVNAKLLTSENQIRRFSKFNANALLRGDTKMRFESYGKARQWGWLSVNDIRKLEDMSPIDGGDQYIVPVNMTTPEKLEEPTPEPGPPAVPPEGDVEPDEDTEGDSDGRNRRAALLASRLT